MLFRVVIAYIGLSYLIGLLYFSFSQGSAFVSFTALCILSSLIVSLVPRKYARKSVTTKRILLGACGIGALSQSAVIAINIASMKGLDGVSTISINVLFLITIGIIWNEIYSLRPMP